MKKMLEICIVLCCLGLVCIYTRTDEGEKLFCQEKSTSEELEIAIESNQIKNFSFLFGEKAICVYEGIKPLEINAYTFAVYKETKGKDILFENIIFIESDTGNMYTWSGEELDKLMPIGSFRLDKIKEVNNSIITTDLMYENYEMNVLMDNVINVLTQNGGNNLELVYDGKIDLINRKYFIYSTFEDFEDRILKNYSYYLDMNSGDLYEGRENATFLRTELYFIGNINE